MTPFASGSTARSRSTPGRRTNRRSTTPRYRLESTSCVSNTGRGMAGASCGATLSAGQNGALDPQGLTSFLDDLVVDRQFLRLAVFDIPLKNDNPMPIS